MIYLHSKFHMSSSNGCSCYEYSGNIMGWMTRLQFPERAETAFYLMGTKGSFPRGKVSWMWSQPLTFN